MNLALILIGGPIAQGMCQLNQIGHASLNGGFKSRTAELNSTRRFSHTAATRDKALISPD